jgi:hypothetical protein
MLSKVAISRDLTYVKREFLSSANEALLGKPHDQDCCSCMALCTILLKPVVLRFKFLA